MSPRLKHTRRVRNVTTPDGAPSSLSARRAALHPKLRPYVTPADAFTGGDSALRSPWVFQIPFTDPAAANAARDYTERKIARYLAEGSLSGAVACIEKPYRLEWLFSHWWNTTRCIPQPVLRDALQFAWMTTEFVTEVAHFAVPIFRAIGFFTDVDDDSDADAGEAMLAESEVPTFPSHGEVTIYRGVIDPAHVGYSWTLERETAERFAARFGIGAPTVLVGRVDVRHVLAYLTRRGEEEVVVPPEAVTIVAREPVAREHLWASAFQPSSGMP